MLRTNFYPIGLPVSISTTSYVSLIEITPITIIIIPPETKLVDKAVPEINPYIDSLTEVSLSFESYKIPTSPFKLFVIASWIAQ